VSSASPPPRPEWVAWARAHKASFEIQPLVERHKGKQVEVGFEVSLFARMDRDVPAEEARPSNLAIYHKLREMLESLVPADHPVARLDVGPLRTAAKLRSKRDFAPEVELSARVIRRRETFEPVAADARARLAFLEDGLLALGLRRGRPGGSPG
jgi:hypothetical protein